MSDKLETVLTDLESATRTAASGAGADLPRLLEMVKLRSEAAIKFRRSLARAGRDLTADEQQRVAVVHRLGTELGERLLIRRAALRADLLQLTTTSRALRQRVQAPPTGCRLDCRG